MSNMTSGKHGEYELRKLLNGNIVELLARLQGDLNEQSVNVVFNAKWVELRTVILLALEDFPEAKVKLSEVLTNVG